MDSYRQGQLSLNRFWLTLTICCAVGIFSCASQELVLTGSWISTEITHPSPFFTEALGDDKHKNITLFLEQAGRFVWLDPKEVCHYGTYLVQDHTLVLTEPQGEAIILGYAFDGDQLRLKSPDGFIFAFGRTPHQANAGTKPCNR